MLSDKHVNDAEVRSIQKDTAESASETCALTGALCRHPPGSLVFDLNNVSQHASRTQFLGRNTR